MAMIHSPSITTLGLVLCLDAANIKSYSGSGTVWTDLTRNNNFASFGTAPTFNTGDNSIVFNGTSNVGTISNNASLNITSQISLEAWIYPTKSSGFQNVICKSSNVANNGYIYPRTDNGWTNSVFYLHIVAVGWSTLSATWPGLNAWYHTIATYDGSNMRIYINGTQRNSKSQTGTITTNSNNLAIGNQPSYNEYYGGRVGLARVYNRALSAIEVLQNFNATRRRFGV